MIYHFNKKINTFYQKFTIHILIIISLYLHYVKCFCSTPSLLIKKELDITLAQFRSLPPLPHFFFLLYSIIITYFFYFFCRNMSFVHNRAIIIAKFTLKYNLHSILFKFIIILFYIYLKFNTF